MRTGDHYDRGEARAERDAEIFGFVPRENIYDPDEHVPCSKCDGVGQWEGFEDRFSYSSGHYTTPRPECCERCEGAGVEPCDLCDEPATTLIGDTPACPAHATDGEP